MKYMSNKEFHEIEVETKFKVATPSIDRSKCVFQNLISIVMNLSEIGYYEIGTGQGIIEYLFSRNQIEPYKERFLNLSDIQYRNISAYH